MEQEHFEKTPGKANRWFLAFIVLSLLYGITFSLHSSINWAFFFGAAYSLFMSYWLLPQQPKIFQGRAKATRASFDREGKATINVDENAVKTRNKAMIVVFSMAGILIIMVIIGISGSNDDDGDDYSTTSTSQEDTTTYETPDASVGTLTDTGNTLINNGQTDSAEVFYDRALEIDPNYLQAIYGKGLVLYNRGFRDDANSRFARAYEGGYRYAWLSWVMADTYDKAGNADRAIELYKESVGLDSSYVDSYKRLAELVSSEKDKYLALAAKHASN